jgi:hypothetical protein
LVGFRCGQDRWVVAECRVTKRSIDDVWLHIAAFREDGECLLLAEDLHLAAPPPPYPLSPLSETVLFLDHQSKISPLVATGADIVCAALEGREVPPAQVKQQHQVEHYTLLFFLFFLRWLTLSPATREFHHHLQAFEALHIPDIYIRVVFSVIVRG